MKQVKKEEFIAALLAITAIFFFLSLISYSKYDLPFFVSNPNELLVNYAGIIGAYLSGALIFLFGHMAMIIPALILFWLAALLLIEERNSFGLKLLTALLFLACFSGLSASYGYQDTSQMFQNGGMTGLMISNTLIKYFGFVGAFFILFAVGTLSFLVSTEFLVIPFIIVVWKGAVKLCKYLYQFAVKDREEVSFFYKNRDVPKTTQKNQSTKTKPIITTYRSQTASADTKGKEDQKNLDLREDKEEKKLERLSQKLAQKNKIELKTKPETSQKTNNTHFAKADKSNSDEEDKKNQSMSEHIQKPYVLPTTASLDAPPSIEGKRVTESLEENSAILEETLRDFNIDVKVSKVNQGPVITRYELELAAGVKVNRITTLSDDIALAMKVEAVRIVAPIPGKAAVGIEVPNQAGAVVYMREIIDSPEYKMNASKLSIALGKTVAGQPVIADLADMPHLLIAGATGSGKTVCVNTLIMSILFNAKPDEVKFIMVDPKMVELTSFNKIPHLLCPVVTDAKKAAGALNWAVLEMENRYKTLARLGARNIIAYNKKIIAEKPEGYEKLPYIVIIIDELADLMMVAQNDIEGAIARLAQLSRAVGIHIVLATQRPSVDVITGVIKANFPARISFKVASKVDSRTVLDMMGADKLLGKGDMLFLQPGKMKPIRIQGAWLKDKEINATVERVTNQGEPVFNEEIVNVQKQKADKRKFEKDENYDEALQIVLQTQQASVSMLQRRLSLGYQRAARIIDMMEAEGIIGPHQGSKPREILVEDDYFEEMSAEKEGSQ